MAAEKAIYKTLATGGAKIIEAIGYAGGSEIPVFTLAYTTDGTGAFTSWLAAPSDVAGLIRYSTPDRSSKNHPIYCFNYYHSVGMNNGTLLYDSVNPDQKTAMQTYAGLWITGFSDGTNNYTRARPNGNQCTGSLVEPLLTHRDLPH